MTIQVLVRTVFLGFATLGLVSCSDITRPEETDLQAITTRASRSEQVAPPNRELPGVAVSVSINVTGSFRPGQPLAITAQVTPNVAVANVEAQLWAPEVEYARASGWGSDYRVPNGVEVPRRDTQTGGAGQLTAPLVLSDQLTIDAPGAYEIVVSVTSDPLVTTFLVNGTIQESVWVYISEDGGSVADEFDGSRLKEGSVRIPGPERPLRGDGTQSAPGEGSGPVLTHSVDGVNVHLYFNEFGSSVDVHGSLVELYEYDFYDNLVNVEAAVTDVNGIAHFSCDPFLNTKAVPHLWGTEATHFVLTSTAVGCGPSDPTFSFNKGSLGRVFLNLEHEVIPKVDSLFNDGRSAIKFSWIGGVGTCFYTKSDDRISIRESCVSGVDGLASIAHEYGHAFHEKALGGNTGTGSCSGAHTLRLRTNYKCAWSEGFAEYVSWSAGYFPAISPFVYTDDWDVTQHCLALGDPPFFPCVEEGTEADHLKVEGAVMSFLNDMTDSSNSEAYDNVTISQPFMADIIETCQVLYGTWVRPERIHWLIHCIQREIDGYNGGGFPPGEAPSNYSVSSGHSVSGTEVRRLWRWHFFNSLELYPPPPSNPIAVTIVGPTEAPEHAYEACVWGANTSGGSGPISYQWTYDQVPVGTDEFWFGDTGNAGEHWLSVTVTDDTGNDTDWLEITVDPGLLFCEV